MRSCKQNNSRFTGDETQGTENWHVFAKVHELSTHFVQVVPIQHTVPIE